MMVKFLLIILSVVCASAAASGQNEPQTAARNELNLGVQAYKNAEYEEAIARFQEAVKLDPELVIAHLYLATAYGQQYVPGVESPENLKLAVNALEQYSQVLKRKPEDETAIKGVAYLNMQMKKFDEAMLYYKRAIAVNPGDAENFYAAGVLDWMVAYRKAGEAHAQVGLKVDDPMKVLRNCMPLRTAVLPVIEEGIDMLNKAISLREDYDDAMVYLNLLYRRRADVQCGDEAARNEDLKQAALWTDRAMAARKKKADEAGKTQPATGSPPR